MSDGNFNRSMLPSNNYQSGIRAGRAQMKHIALDAFKVWCKERFPELSEQDVEEMCLEFKQKME